MGTPKQNATTQPRIVRVESNIKSPNGETWSLDLSESKTLLYGSNTSHKSAVTHAIELALTGAADDVVGRTDVKDPALLLTLAPADQLTAEVAWDHGVASTYRVERKGKTVKKPVHSAGEDAVLPLREVREALQGGAAKARKSFLSWASGAVSLDDVLAHLPSQLHGRYQDIAEKRSPKASAVDALLAVGDYANQRQRAAAREAKGAAVLLNQISGELPARPTDDELVQCREALKAAEQAYELRCQQPDRPRIDVDATTRQLTQARHAEDAWQAEVDRLQAAVEAADDGYSRHAHAVLTHATSQNLSQCPACSSDVGLAHLQSCHDFYSARYKASNGADVEHQTAVGSLSGWTAEVNRLQALLDNASPEPHTLVPSASIETLRNQVHAVQQELSTLETAVSRWGDIASARDKAAAMAAEVESYRALAAACKDAIAALLSTQTKSFCARVQSYLPKAWEFHVELSEGGRQVFRMGLLRNGKLHCALSGAEWATVTTAVAMAVAGDRPAMLIPEDRAWDSKTLKSVMQAFAAFPGQVVLASTTRPAGRLPKGWDMIDMDAWLASQPMPEEASEPETETPSDAPAEFSARSKRMLSGLGFEAVDIGMMSAQSAAEIIDNGLLAHQVVIRKDGTWAQAK